MWFFPATTTGNFPYSGDMGKMKGCSRHWSNIFDAKTLRFLGENGVHIFEQYVFQTKINHLHST